MSRETIAAALAEIDYPGGPDNVDPDLRLAEADALIATGAVVDVDDILFEEQKATWHKLAAVMPKLGWKPLVVYGEELAIHWVPPYATREDVGSCKTPYVDIDWGANTAGDVLWSPAVGQDEDIPNSIHHKSVETFLAWLEAP